MESCTGMSDLCASVNEKLWLRLGCVRVPNVANQHRKDLPQLKTQENPATKRTLCSAFAAENLDHDGRWPRYFGRSESKSRLIRVPADPSPGRFKAETEGEGGELKTCWPPVVASGRPLPPLATRCGQWGS